jgi:hypothetical protein
VQLFRSPLRWSVRLCIHQARPRLRLSDDRTSSDQSLQSRISCPLPCTFTKSARAKTDTVFI